MQRLEILLILHRVSNPNPEMQDLSGTGDKHGGLTSPIGKSASAKLSKMGELENQGAGQVLLTTKVAKTLLVLLHNLLQKVTFIKKKLTRSTPSLVM